MSVENSIIQRLKMQSGYGGVSEIQQLMADGCSPPSLFSISTPPPPPPPPPPNPNAAGLLFQHQHHHHQQQQNLYHHHQHPPPPHFSHLIVPPITQQLFHHPHPHQFQLFLQHHHHHNQLRGLQDVHDASPEASDSPAAPPGPSFLAPSMSFKLGSLNELSTTGGCAGTRDGILRGDDDGSESRLHHSWHREEEESAASIKQPFWRPLDIDYINRNNKRPNSPEKSSNYYNKKSKEALVLIEHTANAAAAVPANYKLFSELEAIYKPGSGGAGGGTMPNNNQTGSGSALTGDEDDNPLLPECAQCPTAIDDSLPDHGSDSSHGEDVPAAPPSSIDKSQKGSSSRRKQRAKRRQQERMSVVAAFFESLVKQVMDHQESLHCKFLQVMERRDQERAGREEAWRKQEAARNVSKAASRAQERALAASREAAIVSFLENITGESLNLPQFPVADDDASHKNQECNALDLYNVDGGGNNNSITHSTVQLNSSRWPKAEVQALIRVRSGLEAKFQEPGLKGPLWEEVSSMMATIGYHRSAKRCKEKWENINKYFRKTKDSGKKRPQHSKTCPYFHLLDQLYAKSSPPPSSSISAGLNNEKIRKDNSELLDAIVVSNDHQSYKFSDIGSTGIKGNEDQAINEAGSSAMAGKSRGNYEDDKDNDNEEDGIDGEEGEGDSQEQGHAQERSDHHHHLDQGQEDPQHDSTFFFQRLRS